MNLSTHFTLAEFIATSHRGIDNTPSDAVLEELRKTAAMLEDVRAMLKNPINISSGFRCSALNKAVGSKPTSKHVTGQAVDFTCRGYGSPLDVCKAIEASGIMFDQLILEFYNPATGTGWVHLGRSASPRRQVLTINSHGTFAGLHP